jgi:hypothetical protein
MTNPQKLVDHIQHSPGMEVRSIFDGKLKLTFCVGGGFLGELCAVDVVSVYYVRATGLHVQLVLCHRSVRLRFIKNLNGPFFIVDRHDMQTWHDHSRGLVSQEKETLTDCFMRNNQNDLLFPRLLTWRVLLE